MSSTEQYPEVSGDESGIVPSQNGRPPEWPKKIRTLTASELDRLTIDGSGRFYWDGKLVNYEPPDLRFDEPVSDMREQSAMDMLERAVSDLTVHKSPTPIEGAELPERLATDLDMVHFTAETPTVPELPISAIPAQVIRGSEIVRVKLSGWQSLGAIIVVLGVLTGAIGVATYGFVAAHDWGCRNGTIQSNCPVVPKISEIPA